MDSTDSTDPLQDLAPTSLMEENQRDAGASAEDIIRRPRTSRLWQWFGRRIPRSEIVFLCQMVLIYVVVGVSLFNLTRGHGTDNLWVALLGSCLGYVLPNPSIEPRVPQ